MIPVNSGGTPIGDTPFTRTGLLGFVGPVSPRFTCLVSVSNLLCRGDGVSLACPQGSLVFVVGRTEGLMMVSGRRHNADDLVATALAVEPVKTVYRGR